jgi:hypothetical protein
MSARLSLVVGLMMAGALSLALWIAFDAGKDAGRDATLTEVAQRDALLRVEYDSATRLAHIAQQELTAKVQKLERELAEQKPETEIIYQTITKEVVKYAQSPANTGCIADPDFVRLWNSAKDGRDPAPTSPGERGDTSAMPTTRRDTEAGRPKVGHPLDLVRLRETSEGLR